MHLNKKIYVFIAVIALLSIAVHFNNIDERIYAQKSTGEPRGVLLLSYVKQLLDEYKKQTGHFPESINQVTPMAKADGFLNALKYHDAINDTYSDVLYYPSGLKTKSVTVFLAVPFVFNSRNSYMDASSGDTRMVMDFDGHCKTISNAEFENALKNK